MKPSPSHCSGTRGSALILFLGVAAALSIAAAALVMLVINTQHSTAMERQRSKAFHVAEAALDVAMEELGHKMPTSATSLTWFDAGSFAARFSPDEFPGADAGNPLDFVQVRLTDNTDATKSFDYNGDGLVFVDAQARVGNKAARVHAQVEAIYCTTNAMRGLALWAGGVVESNGGDPKVTVEVFPPGGTECSWSAKLPGTPAEIGATYMNLVPSGPGGLQRESVLSDLKIAELKSLAQSTGRYFTTVAGPASTPESYNGLCVIEAPSGEVQLTGGTTYNTEDQPGVLLVLGGASLRFGGNTEYFGIVYCESTVSADRTHGTPIVHGMMIVEGGLTASGTPDVRYNDRCVRGLNTQFPVGSRIVPGYWRELKPTM